MNGMNAEECADKQGEPPIDMPESCAPMMPLPANALQSANLRRLAILLYASCAAVFPISQVGPPEIDVYARSGP